MHLHSDKPTATYQCQPRKPHNMRRPDRPHRPRSSKLRIPEAPALLRRGVAAMILVMMALAGATAQDPVYQTVQVLPPYSNKLSHYFATPGRIMSIITTDLNNIDASEYRYYLHGYIESADNDGAIRIGTRSTYRPATPSLMRAQTGPDGGIIAWLPYTLTYSDIQQIFAPQNLEYRGITREQVEKTGLPDGMYRICFRLFINPWGEYFEVGPFCSPPFNIISDLTAVEAPQVILPHDNAMLPPEQMQTLQFTWTMPPGAPATTQYQLRIIELNDESANYRDMLRTEAYPAFFETTVTGAPTYLYTIANPAFRPDRAYAFIIRAVDQFGNTNFKNGGYSEANLFMQAKQAMISPPPAAQPPTPSFSGYQFSWVTPSIMQPTSVKGRLSYKYPTKKPLLSTPGTKRPPLAEAKIKLVTHYIVKDEKGRIVSERTRGGQKMCNGIRYSELDGKVIATATTDMDGNFEFNFLSNYDGEPLGTTDCGIYLTGVPGTGAGNELSIAAADLLTGGRGGPRVNRTAESDMIMANECQLYLAYRIVIEGEHARYYLDPDQENRYFLQVKGGETKNAGEITTLARSIELKIKAKARDADKVYTIQDNDELAQMDVWVYRKVNFNYPPVFPVDDVKPDKKDEFPPPSFPNLTCVGKAQTDVKNRTAIITDLILNDNTEYQYYIYINSEQYSYESEGPVLLDLKKLIDTENRSQSTTGQAGQSTGGQSTSTIINISEDYLGLLKMRSAYSWQTREFSHKEELATRFPSLVIKLRETEGLKQINVPAQVTLKEEFTGGMRRVDNNWHNVLVPFDHPESTPMARIDTSFYELKGLTAEFTPPPKDSVIGPRRSVTVKIAGFADTTFVVKENDPLKIGERYEMNIRMRYGASMRGKVTDALTGKPLANAKVKVIGETVMATTTDSEGKYNLQARRLTKERLIEISKTGYMTDTVTVTLHNEINTYNFVLFPMVRMLHVEVWAGSDWKKGAVVTLPDVPDSWRHPITREESSGAGVATLQSDTQVMQQSETQMMLMAQLTSPYAAQQPARQTGPQAAHQPARQTGPQATHQPGELTGEQMMQQLSQLTLQQTGQQLTQNISQGKVSGTISQLATGLQQSVSASQISQSYLKNYNMTLSSGLGLSDVISPISGRSPTAVDEKAYAQVTDNEGWAGFLFTGGTGDRFRLVITNDPDADDNYCTIFTEITVPYEKSFMGARYRFTMPGGGCLTGTVYLGEGTQKPLEGAEVRASVKVDAEEYTITALTDATGHYKLRNLPVNKPFKLTVGTVKKGTNYVGINKDQYMIMKGGTDCQTEDFHMRSIDGVDISTFMGFPFQTTAFEEKPGDKVILSGTIFLPENNHFMEQRIDITDVEMVKSSVTNSEGNKLLRPVTLPFITELNSMGVKLPGGYRGIITDETGLKFDLYDQATMKGEMKASVMIHSEAQIPELNGNFGGWGFDLPDLLLATRPATDNPEITVYRGSEQVASGNIGANGFYLTDGKSSELMYSVEGFPKMAYAVPDKSFFDRNGLTLHTRLRASIHTLNPRNLELDAGTIRINKKEMSTVNPKPFTVMMGKWKLSCDKWAITHDGVLVSQATLSTGADVMIENLWFTSSAMLTDKSTVHLEKMKLLGVKDLLISTRNKGLRYGYLHSGVSGWSIYATPDAGESTVATLSDMPGLAPGDKIQFTDVDFNSEGESMLVLNSRKFRLYNIVDFTPYPSTRMYVYDTSVKLKGNYDFGIPGYVRPSGAMAYYKDGNRLGFSMMDMDLFRFTHHNVIYDLTHEYKLSEGLFTAKGTVTEPGHLPKLNVTMSHRSTETRVDFDKGQRINMGSGRELANIVGHNKVINNVWDVLRFEGDVKGFNNVNPGQKMNFEVRGTVQATGQQIAVSDIPSFPGVTMTYDLPNARLIGSAALDMNLAGLKLDGNINTVMDSQGWLFTASGMLEIPGLGGANLFGLFGNYQDIPDEVSNLIGDAVCLPAGFKTNLRGFFLSAGLTKQVLPKVNHDYGIVKVHAGVDVSVNARTFMTFGQGTTFGMGVLAEGHAYLGGSLAATCTSASADARMQFGVSGDYNTSTRVYNIDGCASLNLKISASQCIPVLVDCGPCLSVDLADFTIGAKVHLDNNKGFSMGITTSSCDQQCK